MLLSKMILPDSINVDGKFFAIKTGHPYWFRFSELIKEKERRLDAFDFLYDKTIPKNKTEGFKGLVSFFSPKKELPRSSGKESDDIPLDYTLDADLIYAAILEQYHIDLFEKEIHWHKVLAMIAGLHTTKLNDIIGYRLYRKPSKSDTHESEMLRLKKMWRIETEEDKKAKSAEKDFFAKLKK